MILQSSVTQAKVKKQEFDRLCEYVPLPNQSYGKGIQSFLSMLASKTLAYAILSIE